MDRELNGLLENTVPPVDVAAVSAFRTAIQKFEKQAEVFKTQIRSELASQVKVS